MHRSEAMSYGYMIPGMLWPSEQGWLFDSLRNSHSHLEVGTFCGRSLLVSCAGFYNDCRVTCVDMGGDYGGVSRHWIDGVLRATLKVIQEQTKAHVDLIRATSVEAALLNKNRFDSIWIDGDHNYAECKADIEMWSNFLRPGGMICGHDYWAANPGVMEAVQETGPFQTAPQTRIWYRRP